MRQRKIVRLVQIRNERRAAEARHTRRFLFQTARNAVSSYGDEISGYAVVVWNRKGEMHTGIYEGHGPIACGRIPREVGDALQNHIAAEMAQASKVINPFDYEPETPA